MNLTVRRPTARPVAAVAASLLTTLLLVACSSGPGGDGTDGNSGGGGDGGFEPVTVTHALGEAEITSEPRRVVTLGQGSAETAIALGVTPVATERYDWGADDTGQLPWIREAVEERGDEMPELITGGEEVNAEEIAALEPDLVLAPWSGLTQDQYDQISAVAPTVAYPEHPWTIDWKDQITTVATALGKPDRAAELIDGIDDDFAAARADNPDFADHDFAFIYNQGPAENMGVFLPTEQRAAMVANLGFPVAPVVEEMKDDEVVGTDSARFSLEDADRLDGVDLIFTFYSDETNRREMHANPVYGGITAIRDGAEVAPTDPSFVTGSSMINPLTVPWALERYIPMIRDALA
ncbi:iron-siderophore ABC transporter substrate-binding protein [Corynebacterium sp.]|jgi:iron complex transport system substrate-binding protein|uniref:iron-siderophore ABC transporter substrate-binding protein n=1 Tax=Corynebacterium sp. TaxID=1720 RepID=UPI0025BDA744|nr:iron-siderophore ABC transporter substrate-binding protein [Corynebacterium sp.]